MISRPYEAFWPFLFCAKTCAGESNATHPSIYVVNPWQHQTPRNPWTKLLQAIQTQIMAKNGEKWRIGTQKNWLENYFWWVFGHVWTEIFMLDNFPSTLTTYNTFLGQKYAIDFLPPFSHFFTARLTSETHNNPLKVIHEGSMVEYLPVGSKEGPQTIIDKKYF